MNLPPCRFGNKLCFDLNGVNEAWLSGYRGQALRGPRFPADDERPCRSASSCSIRRAFASISSATSLFISSRLMTIRMARAIVSDTAARAFCSSLLGMEPSGRGPIRMKPIDSSLSELGTRRTRSGKMTVGGFAQIARKIPRSGNASLRLPDADVAHFHHPAVNHRGAPNRVHAAFDPRQHFIQHFDPSTRSHACRARLPANPREAGTGSSGTSLGPVLDPFRIGSIIIVEDRGGDRRSALRCWFAVIIVR